MASKPQPPPLFPIYGIDELSKRLAVSKRYLCDLEDGTKPIGQRFRARAAQLLGRTEEELFGPEETPLC